MSQLPKKQNLNSRNTTTVLNPAAKEKRVDRFTPAIVGLCAHCINAADCTYPKDPDKPALNCDEFAGYTERPAAKAAPRKNAAVEAEPAPGLNRGLCRTCANSKDCTFPKPDGGIWRCEEYC
jgi:hypothetical protein